MTTLKPINEQVIVITGASSGIGLATARRAAGLGARVVLVARNADSLDGIVRAIRSNGGEAASIAVDVTEKDAPERIGDFARDRFGGFDSWVNNAAVGMFAPLAETTDAEHRRVFDVGYFALVEASRYAVRHLADHGGGALINVGSVLSERATPLQGAYSAMKHAVLGFTEALRSELRQQQAPVQVTLIKPHGIDTPFPEHALNKLNRPARIPPPLYSPELVAEAICFAVAHPRREILVGGAGLMATLGGNIAPSIADMAIETLFNERSQTTNQPPEPGADNNLFEARSDGRTRSNQNNAARSTSLAMAAQLQPIRTTIVAGLVGAVVLGGIRQLRRRKRAG